MTDPALAGKYSDAFREIFWAKVKKGDGCWEWQGATDARPTRRPGYGLVTVNGRRAKAHRVAWELANGREIPPGLLACHRCDNPPCVRPDHLFVGTMSDNIRDSVAKGRFHPKGDHPHPTCNAGHPRTPEHACLRKNGRWRCRTCGAIASRARYLRDGHHGVYQWANDYRNPRSPRYRPPVHQAPTAARGEEER